MSSIGQVWKSVVAGAIVLVLEEFSNKDGSWVTHKVLVLNGESTSFMTGATRDINLSSVNAEWMRVS